MVVVSISMAQQLYSFRIHGEMDKLVGTTARILAHHKIACVLNAQLFYVGLFCIVKRRWMM